jgi:hypothetical protein
MSELPLAPVPPRTVGRNTAIGMRIVWRFMGGMWRLVRTYSVLEPWVPESLVDPVELAVDEVQIQEVQELADAGEQPAVVQLEAKAAQYPPRIPRRAVACCDT